MKKIVCMLLIVMVIMAGCNTRKEEKTVLQVEEPELPVGPHTLAIKSTVTIYHHDGIVSKTVVEEEIEGNEDSESLLKDMSEEEKEGYDAIGFENYLYDYEIKDHVLSKIIEINYEASQLKEIVEEETNAAYMEEIVNDDYEVVYDKLVKVYKDVGYVEVASKD